MTNAYFTKPVDLAPATKARSIDINNLSSATDAAFDAAVVSFAAKGASAGQVWTGVHDFTGATVTVATQAPGENSAKAASTAYVMALAAQFSLAGAAAQMPNQAGNAGKYLRTNGTIADWSLLPTASIVRSARTANAILVSADVTTLVDITSGTFTQTFTNAATLGSGWYCYVRNSGTGDITLAPAELIDGLASYIVYPGETRLIQCDGLVFRSIVLTGFYRVFTASGTFVKPPGYSAFGGYLWSAGGSGCFVAAGIGGGGGGGGACMPFTLRSSLFGTSETVTIGAGGPSQTSVGSNGTSGGNTTIGTLLTCYGGQGGAANAGGGGGYFGGGEVPGYNVTGVNSNTNQSAGGACHYGGGSGAKDNASHTSGNGGGSTYGGGGGGGVLAGPLASSGGTSIYGNAGTAGVLAGAGAAAGMGGGGGAAMQPATASGAGGRGEAHIWGIA